MKAQTHRTSKVGKLKNINFKEFILIMKSTAFLETAILEQNTNIHDQYVN